MIAGMAPLPTKPTLPTKLKLYRYAAGLAVLALYGAAAMWPDQLPWLSPIATLIAAGAAKYWAIPHTEVLKIGLQLLTPERAAEVAVAALQSMPPAAAEQATSQLLASMPPETRSSLLPPVPVAPTTPTQITFVGAADPTEPPPR